MNFNLRWAALLANVFLCVLPMHAQRTVTASSYPGADLGAQIVAADAALGARPGTIVINQPGTVTTHVVLAAGHSLSLQAPTMWQQPADLMGGNTITCNGESAAITASLPNQNSLFNANNVQHIVADGCTVTATNPGGKGYFFFLGIRVNDVKVTRCHFSNISGVKAQVGGGQGQGMVEDNLARNIVFDGNSVEFNMGKVPNAQFVGMLLVGVDGAEFSHNVIRGGTHGVMYWGGDSNTEIRDRNTPRWARNITISENDCAHVTGSCYWGSMGENVQFLRNKAQRCGDACLDIEGNVNDLVEGNNIVDGNFGILMQNWKLEYRNNTIESTNAGEPLVHLSNNKPNANENLDIYMHDNEFRCTDPNTVCRIEYQDVQDFRFVHNTVTNGVMHPYAQQQQGTDVEDNTFVFDHSNSAPFAAIDASWQVAGKQSRVINNQILSNAPQPPGSQCIRVAWGAAGYPSENFIQGNTCGGSSPFPIDLEMVSNGGRNAGVTFHVAGNHFANNRIVRQDNTHSATFDIRN